MDTVRIVSFRAIKIDGYQTVKRPRIGDFWLIEQTEPSIRTRVQLYHHKRKNTMLRFPPKPRRNGPETKL
jgi:hypothetical protein